MAQEQAPKRATLSFPDNMDDLSEEEQLAVAVGMAEALIEGLGTDDTTEPADTPAD